MLSPACSHYRVPPRPPAARAPRRRFARRPHSAAAWLIRLAAALLAGILPHRLPAQAQRIGSAPPGFREIGAPPFVVIGAEGLGLNSPPTDLHLLSDGRVLVFANPQLAIGDGIRWETYQHAAGDLRTPAQTVAIDDDDSIYVGVEQGFGRVQFSEDGQWRLAFAAAWPAGARPQRPIPRWSIAAGRDWFWHSSSGSLIAWRPGETARTMGQADTLESVFAFDDRLYLSDRPDARLFRLEPDGRMEPVLRSPGFASGGALTCALSFAPHRALVGTATHGLQYFDGRNLTPFVTSGLLAEGAHINALCATEGGYYAAAVEDVGIVFFDHEGRTIQVLDRALDHRLGHVQRLLAADGAVIWGLADNAIVRVQFPSRVSLMEPLIGKGVSSVHPFRFDGRLWLQADGQAYRSDYDAEGRLTRFVPDSPPDRELFTMSSALGVLIASTNRGAFVRTAAGWREFAPGLANLRVLSHEPIDGRWLYGAHHQLGWLHRGPDGLVAEPVPAPEIETVFNTVVDQHGVFWMELGTGRVGRIQLVEGRPQLRIFGAADGVPDGWVQVFLNDGEAGFNIADQILRFDPAGGRFVPDTEFARRFPGLDTVVGRPGRDAEGRLWITANGGVQVLESRSGRWENRHERLPAGFQPYYFTFEDNGVVWMEGEHRLVRYDPAFPAATAPPFRTVITHVTLNGSGRTIFPVAGRMPDLAANDNSAIVHFLAPGNPFAPPAIFEVKLEGADSDWTPAGSAGSAAFNRLKEGSYLLHVRALSGGEAGAEATLAFVVRPPWYRSPYAYAAYLATALGLLWLAAWLSSLLERRENARLARLVAQRTGELHERNTQLAHQLEEIGTLSQALDQSPVAVFITLPDGTIAFVNPRGCTLTGYTVLELVGSDFRRLRAESVSASTLEEIAAATGRGETWRGELVNRRKDGALVHVRTTVAPIRSPAGPIRHHLILEEDITEWIAEQNRRRQLEAQLFQAQKLESLGTLAGGIAHDFNNILTGILGFCELARLEVPAGSPLDQDLREIRTAGLRAKDLVAQILTFSRQGNASQVPLDLARPVAEAVKLIRASTPATIEIEQRLTSAWVRADPTQIHQIVVNLCTNAVHAVDRRSGRIVIAIERIVVDRELAAGIAGLPPGPCVRLSIADNGHGMDEATLNRIFDPFFTTKSPGEGTGLGLSIVQGMVASHGGTVRVLSQSGRGTTFEIFLPPTDKMVQSADVAAAPPRGGGEAIMVVDDEPTVAAFIASRLTHYGYRPEVHHDPLEALATFTIDPSRFAALVTDLTMPHLTGIDLLHRLRLLHPGLPAIIVTGYGRELTREKLAAFAHCAVLQKPFDGEALVQVLGQVIASAATDAR